jgi:hypothetical protein
MGRLWQIGLVPAHPHFWVSRPGYQEARESIRRILKGENPGLLAEVAQKIAMVDRQMSASSGAVGLLKPADSADYPWLQRRQMSVGGLGLAITKAMLR